LGSIGDAAETKYPVSNNVYVRDKAGWKRSDIIPRLIGSSRRKFSMDEFGCKAYPQKDMIYFFDCRYITKVEFKDNVRFAEDRPDYGGDDRITRYIHGLCEVFLRQRIRK